MKLMDISTSTSSLHGPLDVQVYKKKTVPRVEIPNINITSSGDGSYFSLSNSEQNMYSKFDLLSSQLSHRSFLSATPVPVQGGNKKQIENSSTQVVSKFVYWLPLIVELILIAPYSEVLYR
jgi:hypothetical protein